MPVIHIFNPETDYALASFSPFYTPPASVIALRSARAFIPAYYAKPGDYILTLDSLPTPPDFPSYLRHIHLSDLPALLADQVGTRFFASARTDVYSDFRFQPWGWNPALRHTLLQAGVPDSYLPDDWYIQNLRDISHRALTIPFNAGLSRILPDCGSTSPTEFQNAEMALEWYQRNISHGNQTFFKAPWSSSGRGIMFTDELESNRHILPWIRGIIRKQGSVIGEVAIDKSVDFASEWEIITNEHHRGEARFLGWSLFEASRRGKYHSNFEGDPAEIPEILKEKGVKLSPEIIAAQKQLLELYCGQYRGYCGIDMLADTSGRVYPCIEINWRLTMGLIHLLKSS